MVYSHEELREQTRQALADLLCAAKLKKGCILVVGGSSSEVAGKRIGSDRNLEIAKATPRWHLASGKRTGPFFGYTVL